MFRTADPDPVLWAIQFLDEKLPDVRVGDEFDGHLPFVAVRTDGGTTRDRFFNQARLGITVWHHSQDAVQSLAGEVASWVRAAQMRSGITTTDCGLPAKVEDSSGHPKRFMTAEVTFTQLTLPGGD